METSGIKNRLEDAKEKKEFVKLIFQYPNAQRAIVKRGFVICCYNDSFDFNERFDGNVTFSYDFIVEISNVYEGEEK